MTLLHDLKLFGFGQICSSCAPGGSGSNVWSLLLGGDISLSLTMTFMSITASLGESQLRSNQLHRLEGMLHVVVMMPTWIWLEGRFFIDVTVQVPYLDIIKSLFLFVVPLFIGKWLSSLKSSM